MTAVRPALPDDDRAGVEAQLAAPMTWEGSSRKRNPFARASTDPLQVTLNEASFVGLSPEQSRALALLRELAFLEEIDLVGTAPTTGRHLAFEPKDERSDIVPLELRCSSSPEALVYAGVRFASQHEQTATGLVARSGTSVPAAYDDALRDTLVCHAHMELDRHLLVTESPWIFDPVERNIVRPANPRGIVASLKIVGLFLRSRGVYTYQATRWGGASFDEELFYFVLARHLTPALWKYLSACWRAESCRGDDTARIGWSVLTRCERAFQARDEMGWLFYSGGGRDRMMYHFDYLTLLLAGAIDAEMRIAHRAYGVSGSERNASPRSRDHVARLAASGATELVALLRSRETTSFMTMLYEVRNTIHAAGLGSYGFSVPANGGLARLQVSQASIHQGLLEAAEDLGGAEAWGFSRDRFRTIDGTLREPVLLAPYTFARQLIRFGVPLIDGIARATEVERLHGSDGRELRTGPPQDRVFGHGIPERVALLG